MRFNINDYLPVAMSNLLKNAVQDGGGDITVTISERHTSVTIGGNGAVCNQCQQPVTGAMIEHKCGVRRLR